MHYFSLHTQDGSHLGFFVMIADDETQSQPQSGRFTLKLQSEKPSENQAAAQVVSALAESDEPLFWRVEKDRVELFAGSENIGSIRNEYLTLSGCHLILNDLTGMI
ncbi:HLGFF motif protein [Neisseria lisongii]|uniref:Uncharacterized protein n=1 Tax=Neisseria lisongii TaxID=2912188 RepID=A0AAW5ACU5_9NEIS|nr:hypothetical protein [Neisseria lisongii]MCF7528870.1 hypothetical protein [Neisseria lisongii]